MVDLDNSSIYFSLFSFDRIIILRSLNDDCIKTILCNHKSTENFGMLSSQLEHHLRVEFYMVESKLSQIRAIKLLIQTRVTHAQGEA